MKVFGGQKSGGFAANRLWSTGIMSHLKRTDVAS